MTVMVKKLLTFLLLMCATGAAAQAYNEKYGFKGKLNNKIPIEIVWYTGLNDGEWVNAGYIYYPNAKNPAPILIVGEETKVDPKAPNSDNLYAIKFTEYQPDGAITGRFTLMYYEVEGDYHFYKGSWTNPATGKSLPMTQMEAVFDKPSWVKELPSVLHAPKREAWRIEKRFDKDENGWLSDIHVDFFVNGQKSPLSFEEPLCIAYEADRADELQWIREEDVNFDGIPDIMVFIGMTVRTQDMYKVFVWNPATRQYYYVEAFESITDPNFDEKKKTIDCVIRDVNTLYFETYKWKNGKLTQISSKKEKLE